MKVESSTTIRNLIACFFSGVLMCSMLLMLFPEITKPLFYTAFAVYILARYFPKVVEYVIVLWYDVF